MKHKLVPFVSVAIGVIAFILTSTYLRNQLAELEAERERLHAGARKIWVVAAARPIPKNTIIEQSDLGKREVYQTETAGRDPVVPEDAPLIIGKRATFNVETNQVLFWTDIEGSRPLSVGLSATIKSGMRAISLPVSGSAAVSGMIQPNDRIDVLGTFSFPSDTMADEMETVTLTVLQDVTVLATGTRMANSASQRSQKTTSYNSVTLEVTPREAELLVFAQHTQGRISFSLRNPTDVYFEKDLPEINFNHLENKLPELNLYRQQHIRHKREIR